MPGHVSTSTKHASKPELENGKSAYNGADKGKGKGNGKPERVVYTHDKGSDEAICVGLWTHEGDYGATTLYDFRTAMPSGTRKARHTRAQSTPLY